MPASDRDAPRATSQPPVWVYVGRIIKPHGVRGEVVVEVRTDEPERRFQPGAILQQGPGHQPTGEPLTIHSARPHGNRWLIMFDQLQDRNQADELRGTMLSIQVDPHQLPDDPDEFYSHQLLGLQVVDLAGTPLGTVAGVSHATGQTLLQVDTPQRQVLFPFVAELVPHVDLEATTITVDDRPGLFTEEL